MWVLFWNHVEGAGRSKPVTKLTTLLAQLCLIGLPAWFLLSGGQTWATDLLAGQWTISQVGTASYALLCCLFSVGVLPTIVWQRHHVVNPPALSSVSSVVHDLRSIAAESSGTDVTSRLLLALPRNSALKFGSGNETVETEAFARGPRWSDNSPSL